MSLKVYIGPPPQTIAENNGIGRVIHAQYRYLPALDIELVPDPAQADITSAHAPRDPMPNLDHLALHGLYWNGDPGSGRYAQWHADMNAAILANARSARAVSVPSPWVGEFLRRDLHIIPTVIGHGLDFDHWQPGENAGYVLWNKSRREDVCNPIWPYRLAEAGLPVVSTFAPDDLPELSNLLVTGHLTAPDMARRVRAADVYLATTPETFGIGTLEAMACGVPILGFRWGGTADLVRHKLTGWLAEPGDVDGLLEGYEWLRANRSSVSEAAREAARAYDWPNVIGKYADLYRSLASGGCGSGVSVIITNHDYAQWVGEAIESVLKQTRPADELIVVDDGSTDDSRAVIDGYGERVTAIYQDNAGVASARNAGAERATGEFLVFLDADDRIAPEFLATLLPPMQADRGLGIAYSGLILINPDGTTQPAAYPPPFSWARQSEGGIPPASCIPSACLLRRDLWARAGGVKQDYKPGEDTEFWTRGLSRGYDARKISEEPLFEYRVHAGGAHLVHTYVDIAPWHPWMTDKQYPAAAPAEGGIIVRSYARPLVSVILTKPDLRRDWVNDCDRLEGQTLRRWQGLVIGDVPAAYPWARDCKTLKEALAQADAPLVLVTDQSIDTPDWLMRQLSAFELSGGRRIACGGLVLLPTDEARTLGAKGVEKLMCGCASGGKSIVNEVKQAMGFASSVQAEKAERAEKAAVADAKRVVNQRQRELVVAERAPLPPDIARLEYLGLNDGTISQTVNGRTYKGARIGPHRFTDAPIDDARALQMSGKWRIVRMPEVETPRTVAFRYLGREPQPIHGAAGQLLGTVDRSAARQFIRVPLAEAEYVKRAYNSILEEVAA